MDDILIAIAFFATAFGIIYVIFTARNRERMAMIEKSINPAEFKPQNNTGALLKWALLIVGLGLGFFVGSLLETYTGIRQEPAYFGSVLFFGGTGLLVAYLIHHKKKED
ncbi:MAG: DUF6249 domain-containing protein [Bacteroidales bacterium]